MLLSILLLSIHETKCSTQLLFLWQHLLRRLLNLVKFPFIFYYDKFPSPVDICLCSKAKVKKIKNNTMNKSQQSSNWMLRM